MSDINSQKKSKFIIKDGKKILEPILAKQIAKVVSEYNLTRMTPTKRKNDIMNDTEKIVELTNIAKQYRSDCETRIDCLISEKIDLVTEIDQETFDRFGSDGITDDVDAQIEHWQATIKGIDTMLEKVK